MIGLNRFTGNPADSKDLTESVQQLKLADSTETETDYLAEYFNSCQLVNAMDSLTSRQSVNLSNNVNKARNKWLNKFLLALAVILHSTYFNFD